MSLTLSSPAFEHQGEIPKVHTCDGANSPPPLAWRSAPDGTRSLALIVDDPDAPDPAAPTHTYVHCTTSLRRAPVSTRTAACRLVRARD